MTDHVHVVGATELAVPVPLPADHGLPTRTLDAEFECSSGEPIPGTWVGLDVGALLDAVDAPASTTHLLVEGADGFTVCVPVGPAGEGVLAFERDGGDAEDVPRFVAPGIAGTRTVKAVRRLETAELDPEDDPERFEDLLQEA